MLRDADQDGKRPLTSHEWVALKCMWAACSVLKDDHEKLKERLQACVPGGWRDIRLATTKLDKLLDEILGTIPQKKLRSIASEMANTELRIITKGPQTDRNIVHLEDREIAELVNLLIYRECMLCEKTDKLGKRCPIYKAVTNCLHYDLPDVDDGHCALCGLDSIELSE